MREPKFGIDHSSNGTPLEVTYHRSFDRRVWVFSPTGHLLRITQGYYGPLSVQAVPWNEQRAPVELELGGAYKSSALNDKVSVHQDVGRKA